MKMYSQHSVYEKRFTNNKVKGWRCYGPVGGRLECDKNTIDMVGHLALQQATNDHC